MRKCSICDFSSQKKIYTQKFSIIGKKKAFIYDVVICLKCGFVFASNIPSQKNYEKFYKENTKYSFVDAEKEVPQAVKESNEYYYLLTETFLRNNFKRKRRDLRILDAGCGSGYLLSIFKKHGYKRLMGIDPSPSCRILAKKLYGVDVKTFLISEFKDKKKFDLIILSNVLEHIEDLRNNLLYIASFLKEKGFLFISVPDGDNFGKVMREPFLEFSLEHINYFTITSLTNLCKKFGLDKRHYESRKMETFGAYTSNSFWQKNGNKIGQKITYDKSGEEKIRKYIFYSNKKQEKIKKIISTLIQSSEELVIWGVGSLTSRLLANTNLINANIKFFVDSNKAYQGKKIIGYKILSPENLKNTKHTVLIASYVHSVGIRKTLENNLGYKGKIINLN
ncbi:MAG: hypothetical protein COU25_04065 [Candidatus Levybacteria bacterium CG10_big_fil_rev_8_21_14_0_10_35_13]|nr:MAG: hypothetical protein COU25_04065 [Candidatus Levybacteria bacterium CG10_big_fil_rev_8_21_14_0_10_35_13]